MATHECPAIGCTQQVPFNRLSCRPHWFRLPDDLRDRVWKAYQNRGRDPRGHADVVREAMDWYRAHP